LDFKSKEKMSGLGNVEIRKYKTAVSTVFSL